MITLPARFLVPLVLSLGGSGIDRAATNGSPGAGYDVDTVARVLDANTVKFERRGVVRLAGARTPRFGGFPDCFQYDPDHALRALLPPQSRVRLAALEGSGGSGGGGGTEALVFRADDGAFVNGEVVRRGYARAYALHGTPTDFSPSPSSVPSSSSYDAGGSEARAGEEVAAATAATADADATIVDWGAELVRLEASAQAAHLGLWKQCSGDGEPAASVPGGGGSVDFDAQFEEVTTLRRQVAASKAERITASRGGAFAGGGFGGGGFGGGGFGVAAGGGGGGGGGAAARGPPVCSSAECPKATSAGCADFGYYEDALEWLEAHRAALSPAGVARLDRDGDGVPCPGLPHTPNQVRYRVKAPARPPPPAAKNEQAGAS